MEDGSLKQTSTSINTQYWIRLLLLLLAVANILVFIVYFYSQSSQNIASVIWNYLESEPFKAITISIVLPIAILLLENIFEVRKTHQEKLDERNKILDERREEKRKNEIAIRWEVINQTESAYNTLCSLSEELILSDIKSFENRNKEELSKSQYIGDFIKRLSTCTNSWTTIINGWHHLFPKLDETLKDDDNSEYVAFSDEVAYLLNILINCLEAVAISFLRARNEEETKRSEKMQLNLLPILWGFQVFTYRQMMHCLKASIEAQFGTDKEAAQKRIEENLDWLKSGNDSLREEETKYCKFFSALKDDKARKSLLDKYEQAENAGESEFQKKFEDLKTELKKVKHTDLMLAMEIPCSLDLLDHLACWFVFKRVFRELKTRREAKGLKSELGNES